MDGNGAEQRVFDRINVRFSARLNKRNSAEGVDVIIKDFSPTGARVLASQKVTLFDRLSLSFSPSKDSSVVMDGHVVYIDKDNPDSWHVGIKFDDVDLLRANRIMDLCQ